MQFVDPFPATCQSCGNTRQYKLDDLLNLRTSCEVCGYDLSSVGKQMNAMLDDEAMYFTVGELAFELGERFGIRYEEAELEKVTSVGLTKIDDILNLTATK